MSAQSPIAARNGRSAAPVFNSLKKLSQNERRQLIYEVSQDSGIDGSNGSNGSNEYVLWKDVLFVMNADKKGVSTTLVTAAVINLSFFWEEDKFSARSQLLKIAHQIEFGTNLWNLIMTGMKSSDTPDDEMRNHIGRIILLLTHLINRNDVHSVDSKIQKDIALSLLHYMHSGITGIADTATVVDPVLELSSMDDVYGLLCLMMFKWFHQNYNFGKEDVSNAVDCLRFYVAKKMSVIAKKELRKNHIYRILLELMNRTVASGVQDDDSNVTAEDQLFEDTVGELYSSLFVSIFHYVPLVRVE